MRVATASIRASHFCKTPANQTIPPTHKNNLSLPMVDLAVQISEKRYADDAVPTVIPLLNATLAKTKSTSTANRSKPTKV